MIGESIALVVAVSWTASALIGELAGRHIRVITLNVLRMALSLIFLGAVLWFITGKPYPTGADAQTWKWMLLSGLMGYGFGDYCLFSSYQLIGSRYAQLFMTLAAPFAALSAWLLMGESMSTLGLLGMFITLLGIGMSILNRKDDGHKHHHIGLKLPRMGFVFGLGAALGQGVGLVLSKVGLMHYTQQFADDSTQSFFTVPIGGTAIRAIAGLACFLFMLMLRRELSTLPKAVRDGKGMGYTILHTLCGPGFGVVLSMLAIQYASAGVAQTLMSLTPILILWPSHLLFGTAISRREVLGAIIAVAGATLFFI